MAKRPGPTSTGWDDRLRGLAALLPLFNSPGSDPDTAINALNEAAYRLGWVLADFDWSEWAHGPECQSLVTNSANVASTDPLTLARLLTAHLRLDRFCEGHLQAAFQDGHLTAIVRRAEALVRQHTPDDDPFWDARIFETTSPRSGPVQSRSLVPIGH